MEISSPIEYVGTGAAAFSGSSSGVNHETGSGMWRQGEDSFSVSLDLVWGSCPSSVRDPNTTYMKFCFGFSGLTSSSTCSSLATAIMPSTLQSIASMHAGQHPRVVVSDMVL